MVLLNFMLGEEDLEVNMLDLLCSMLLVLSVLSRVP